MCEQEDKALQAIEDNTVQLGATIEDLCYDGLFLNYEDVTNVECNAFAPTMSNLLPTAATVSKASILLRVALMPMVLNKLLPATPISERASDNAISQLMHTYLLALVLQSL